MSEYRRRVANITEEDKDPEQKKAFETTESCVVIAGPGSGKTYLLTTKVAKLMFEEVIAPRGVACLTFSNLLMEQLKEDLRSLGVLGESRLFVGTVHSFCLKEVIHRYEHLYDEIDLPDPFRIASEKECIEAVQTALSNAGIDYEDRVDVNRFGQGWDDLVKYLSKYRRLNPYCQNSDFYDTRWEDLPGSYYLSQLNWDVLAQQYVHILRHSATPSVDFTEIEIIALKMIERYSLVREMLESRYPWFAIDEYQDLGYPFHRMITRLLSETGIQIFAIGDPDQCIYEELLGTSHRYIIKLAKQVASQEGSRPITLKHNYRCPPRFIRISERILGESKDYQSCEEGGICLCYQCQDFEEQQHLIFEAILPSLLSDSDEEFSLGDIAILHPWRGKPDGQGVNRLSQALDTLENGWEFTLDKDVVYDSSNSKVIGWLEQAARWCLYGWESGRPYFRDLVPFWMKLNTDPHSQSLTTSQFELKQALFNALWRLRRCKEDNKISFANWINSVREELSLESLLTSYELVAPDDVKEFKQITKDLEADGRLSGWPLSRFAKGPDRIQLTTLHSSKGTQFKAVVIAGFDKVGFFSSGLSEQDRRLAYVAITRAKRRLYLLFEGEPEILELLMENPPEGCYFKW
jgi:DNA helicase-2/ATP-dependent DNA helicase PcrA